MDPPSEVEKALEELRAGLDEVLDGARRWLHEWDQTPVTDSTDVTPDVGGALWDLVRTMPGVIGNSLSGEDARVDGARASLARLDGRLRAAGVELGEPFTGYADRLAGLREEMEPASDASDGP